MKNETFAAFNEVRKEIEKKELGTNWKYASSVTNGNFMAIAYRREYAEIFGFGEFRYKKHEKLFLIKLSEKHQWEVVDESTDSFHIVSAKKGLLKYSHYGKDRTYKFKGGD